MASHHHRSGPLKQQNKKHKTGKHESKSLISKKSGGKVDRKALLKGSTNASALQANSKQQRMQKQKLQRQKQKEELWMKKRLGAGSHQGPPKIVALVALSEEADLAEIKKSILQGASSMEEPQQDVLPNVVVAAFAQHKQKICVVECGNDPMMALDAAKVADLVVFVLPVQNGEEHAVSANGDKIMSCLRAQGMPSLVGVVSGLESLAPKAQSEMKKFGTRFFQSEFGDQVKVTFPSSQSQITRAILSLSPKTIHWRESRSYLLASSAKMVPSTEQADVCDLHVSGYLRGKPLSVNQLMHITDVGTFQMEFIAKSQVKSVLVDEAAAKDPSLQQQQQQQAVEDYEVLVRANPSLQEDLKYEADVDPFAAEQTWPTKEELEQAEQEAKRNKTKSIPGMSDYQAAWMTEDDPQEERNSKDIAMDDDNEGDLDEDEQAPVPQGFCKTGSSTRSDVDDEDEDGDDISMADEDDLATREKEMAKRKLEKENMEFPDEVEVPTDSMAKTRFARYRGLKSMRTSVWDPKESLPMDYARLFQFDDFVNTQRRVLSQAKQVEEDLRTQMTQIFRKQSMASSKPRSSTMGSAMDQDTAMEDVEPMEASNEETAKLSEGYVATGIFVTICIKQVPIDKLCKRIQEIPGTPLIMGALLRHENRLSVLNFSIQRATSGTFGDATLKSKDTLQFHCGFRRFEGRPIYSDQSLKSDKHLFHRFLPQSGWCVASVYGPATFQPASVLLFRSTGKSQDQELVASGTLLNVDPDRIVLKRVVITGTPVKVKKRKAVVRYMFHSPEDVRWFKPIELVTKHGMTGHIKESLGTHGDFKAVFNKPVKQHDTVCLNLYKRVYPKFLTQ